MIDLGHLASNPLALLAAAVVVLWVARTLANMAFKIVLVLAVVGAAAVAGGASLPTGMNLGTLTASLQSGVTEAIAVGGVLLKADEKKEAENIDATRR